MRITQYMGGFLQLRKALNSEKRILSAFRDIVKDDYYEDPRFEEDLERVEKRVAHLDRLYDRYLMRLWWALDLVKSTKQRRILTMYYMYGFNQKQIAEKEYYSERQIFRILQAGRYSLEKALLKIMPRAVRTASGKYRRLPK